MTPVIAPLAIEELGGKRVSEFMRQIPDRPGKEADTATDTVRDFPLTPQREFRRDEEKKL